MSHGQRDGFDDDWGSSVQGYAMTNPPGELYEELRLAALQKEPALKFVWAESPPQADESDPIEVEAEILVDEPVTELIIQDTPDMPVIVQSRASESSDDMTFEQIIQPIAVELGSAFTAVVDEFGQESTIRLDGPAEARGRVQAKRHRGGVTGYGSRVRVLRLHPENIAAVTSNRNRERVSITL
ncbi:MAG: hypothetical protein QOG54_468 [Actinomycetota bacterium]|jgi:hypothetical protein|nr:hypothetical protein [Actinomycetota bacterium]